MADLHPFFVHFPIALLTVAVFFDIYGAIKLQVSSTKTAFILQAIAGLGALFAVMSGNSAETILVGQPQLAQGVSEALTSHVSMGNTTMWIILIAILVRSFTMLEQKIWAPKVWIFSTLSLALAGLVVVTGLLGGQLSSEILHYFMIH